MPIDKKFIITINTIMIVFFIFFEIFFGIYVYNISKNINLVLCYNIFKLISSISIILVLYKIATRKKLIILYRLSFVFAFLSILISLFISPEMLFMIFIAQFFLAITEAFYYLPYEVAIMNKNSKRQMFSFISILSAFSLFVSTLSPFLSGLIIDVSSYIVLFAILILLVVMCFIFQAKLNLRGESLTKLGF